MEFSEFGEFGDFDDELEGQTVVLFGVDVGAYFAQRYRIEEVLGQGAMGKVVRATDIQTGRVVAIKVLHADKAEKEQVATRFRREAEILSKLGHPGIVEVVEFGRTAEGTDYLVMELLDGVSMKDYVREHGPMPPNALLPLLVTVCDALGAAHEQGIIHRDLKPENVLLVERDGALHAKVVDFGLSRLGTGQRITRTGVMIGTPRYMAPEQIRSAKDVDSRTDVYACGVLAYETLTGRSPFPAEDAGQLLGCVIENRTIPLGDLRPDLPPALGAVLKRAFAKLPTDRYATMGAFAEAFAAAIGQTTGRSALLTESGIERLFTDAEETDGRLEPLAQLAGPGPVPDGPPRFTLPGPEPTGPLRRAGEPAPAAAPRAAKKARSPLALVAGFFVALVVVACVGGAAALGLRGCLRAGGPAGMVDAVRAP